MKRVFLVLFFFLSFLSVSAQYNFYKLGIGIGAGATQYYGDIPENPPQRTIKGVLDFHLTPFTSIGLEIQNGIITGGDSITNQHKRYFKNNYSAVILNGKVSLGQIVITDFSNFLTSIRGVYLGTGVGVIMNNQKEIIRTKINPDGRPYTFPGKNKSTELMIPANVGINYDILDRWGYTRFVLNFNYQFAVTFGENLDGYNDPPTIFKNGSPDMYSSATVGIKYCFGPEGLY